MAESTTEAMAGPKSDRAQQALTQFTKAQAAELGFDICHVTLPSAIPLAPQRLKAFVDAGYHGDMGWMEETLDRRGNPSVLWPDVRSIVVLGMNYGPDGDPLATLTKTNCGSISVYARNRDYHDVIKGKLKELATRFAARCGKEVKVFVDTAPVMEKPLAQAAGLGWQGKHTNLVSRTLGSWLFLGSMFTTAELNIDAPERDHCGTCRACLDACPTKAFPAPYTIDARLCISYLTIEHKGVITPDLRKAFGNRIYGCDDCLAACPWNKFAEASREMKLSARDDLKAPPLVDLLALNDSGFRAFFSGSPIKRIGRDRFIRNCLIGAGNSGDPSLIASVLALAEDVSVPVRGMAVWALSRLMEPEQFDQFAAGRAQEADAEVRAEFEIARMIK